MYKDIAHNSKNSRMHTLKRSKRNGKGHHVDFSQMHAYVHKSKYDRRIKRRAFFQNDVYRVLKV